MIIVSKRRRNNIWVEEMIRELNGTIGSLHYAKEKLSDRYLELAEEHQLLKAQWTEQQNIINEQHKLIEYLKSLEE